MRYRRSRSKESSYRRSRSRSQRKTKHSRRFSSSSRRSSSPERHLWLDLDGHSQIKDHFIYEDVPIDNRNDEEDIIREVKEVLRNEFGKVEHASKVKGDHRSFSFAIGFRYDLDAYNCFHSRGSIESNINNTRLIAKITPTFQLCLPQIELQLKQQMRQKEKEKQREREKQRQKERHLKLVRRDDELRRQSRRSEGSRHRHHSSSSSDSYSPRIKDNRSVPGRRVWLFGLPWVIKGKQIERQLGRNKLGPFEVLRWRWVRVRDSNCQFMEVILSDSGVLKLLGAREGLLIEGFPVVVAEACASESMESVKGCLRQFQFRIQFNKEVSVAGVYKAINDWARVVQLVSAGPQQHGKGQDLIVTVNSSNKAGQLRRSGQFGGVRVEDVFGQLVYRPNKHSQLRAHSPNHHSL